MSLCCVGGRVVGCISTHAARRSMKPSTLRFALLINPSNFIKGFVVGYARGEKL
jgi:hypothetical protein